MNEVTSKMEEYMRHVAELNIEKSRFTVENVELARQLDEAESSVMQLQKMKSALTRLGHHQLTAPDAWGNNIIRNGIFQKEGESNLIHA